MKLYFTRHGESEANIIRQISNRGYKLGLTEKGCEQASTLAKKLRDNGIIRIYTSPLKRAVETAQILSDWLDVPFETTYALREFDCGIVEDGADVHSWELWHWVWDEWLIHHRLDSKIEGGESYLELQARLYPFVNSLLNSTEQQPGNYVLVGHGGLFSSVLPGLLTNETVVREKIKDLGFSNTAYVLAESRPEGLICLEWCGVII